MNKKGGISDLCEGVDAEVAKIEALFAEPGQPESFGQFVSDKGPAATMLRLSLTRAAELRVFKLVETEKGYFPTMKQLGYEPYSDQD